MKSKKIAGRLEASEDADLATVTLVVDPRDVADALARRAPADAYGNLFADIIRRRALRKELTGMLRGLNEEERISVLVDILVDVEVTQSAPAGRPRLSLPKNTPKPAKKPRRWAFQGKGAALLGLVTAHPGMPLSNMATAIYGDDGKHSQTKARSLLSALQYDGRIRKIAAGGWEVVS